MKVLVTAVAAVLFAGSAIAGDLDAPKSIELYGGLAAGGKVDMNFDTGTEEWALEATPQIGITKYGASFTVGSTFNIMELNEDDNFKGLDFEAGYSVTDNLTVYGEIGTDKDFEFGDAKVGAVFAF